MFTGFCWFFVLDALVVFVWFVSVLAFYGLCAGFGLGGEFDFGGGW